MSEKILINAIILIYIIQRLYELKLSNKNEAILIYKYQAIPASNFDSMRMRLFHTFWFLFLAIEANYQTKLPDLKTSAFVLAILFGAQVLRFYTMIKLGPFWTIKIMKFEGGLIFSHGPYKMIRHPNYFAVIIEFIFLPLLLKSYYTLFIFSFLNIYVLKKRIDLEESELMKNSEYLKNLGHLKRIIPFLY